MKQVLITLTILFSAVFSQAQQGYSVTIDADDAQYYTVTIGTKLYTSSSIGHLVINNLKDSTYKLAFSFPRSTYASQTFTVSLNEKVKSFKLKKNAEKSWSLLDWQTMQWIASNKAFQSYTATKSAYIGSSRGFAQMMAAVVNDTAVLHITPVVAREVPKKLPEQNADITAITEKEKKPVIPLKDLNKSPRDSGTVVKTRPVPPAKDSMAQASVKSADSLKEVTKVETKIDSILPTIVRTSIDSVRTESEIAKVDSPQKLTPKIVEEPSKPTDKESVWKSTSTPVVANVALVKDQTTDSVRELTFVDSANGKADTVAVRIELEKDAVIEKPKGQIVANDSVVKKSTLPTENETPKANVPKNDSAAREVAVEKAAAVDSIKVVTTDSVWTSPKKVVLINSDCKNFAMDSDVDRLRIKLLNESNLDERIAIAKKEFKKKCFTTKQIRALTELFVNDKMRYGFFDVAYPFVSDTENFKELIDQLTDEYYIARFKAMVRM